MKLLRQYDNPEEAYIVQGLLKNYDIASEVNSSAENMVFGVGVTDIYVNDGDLMRANEVLDAHKD